jgi:hypothetical protein
VTFNDPGDDVTGRHAPRKRRPAAKSANPEQTDAFAGTSTPPQPVRTPSAGERRKDHAIDAHEQRHQDRLRFLREELRKLYRERRARPQKVGEEAFVTADDAFNILKANANLGHLDDDADKNWFGALFKERGWLFIGRTVPSLRDSANGRHVRCWAWRGE